MFLYARHRRRMHPWRDEKGSFATKENDAFACTGTNRGDHKANLELAKKHGFEVTADRFGRTCKAMAAFSFAWKNSHVHHYQSTDRQAPAGLLPKSGGIPRCGR